MKAPKLKRPRKTPLQRKVMGIVLRAAGEGRFLRIQELHAEVQKEMICAYSVLRKCLERLDRLSMIRRQRVGMESEVIPLERGYDWFRPER